MAHSNISTEFREFTELLRLYGYTYGQMASASGTTPDIIYQMRSGGRTDKQVLMVLMLLRDAFPKEASQIDDFQQRCANGN